MRAAIIKPAPASSELSPGKLRSAKTRAAILTAAEGIFARSGFAGARTEAIAAGAGVNKAMLYYYFKSKDQLYQAIVEDHFCAFNGQAMALLASPGPARSVLLQYVELQFDFIAARHRYASLHQQLMLTKGKSFERTIRTYFLPRARALEKLLERGMRDAEFRRVNARHAALSIAALIVFYFSAPQVIRIIANTDIYSSANLRRRKKEVLDFIRHALFLKPNGASP